MEQVLVILSLMAGGYAIYQEKRHCTDIDRSLDAY